MEISDFNDPVSFQLIQKCGVRNFGIYGGFAQARGVKGFLNNLLIIVSQQHAFAEADFTQDDVKTLAAEEIVYIGNNTDPLEKIQSQLQDNFARILCCLVMVRNGGVQCIRSGAENVGTGDHIFLFIRM